MADELSIALLDLLRKADPVEQVPGVPDPTCASESTVSMRMTIQIRGKEREDVRPQVLVWLLTQSAHLRVDRLTGAISMPTLIVLLA